MAKLELTSSDFLFKALYRTRKSIGLRTKHKKLSYTRTREVLVSRLREVAPQGFNLGLHSLRAGGASAAARANVNERCWRRHGRWKSDAAHGYVKDSIDHRLTALQYRLTVSPYSLTVSKNFALQYLKIWVINVMIWFLTIILSKA